MALTTSVAICTYNGEKFIKDQLYSILSQTILPDEIILCDDGSTDNTLFMAEKILANASCRYVINTNRANKGAKKNFEQAIALCTGDIIFLADQDDMWKSNKIEKIISWFEADKSAQLIFTDGDLIDQEGCLLVNQSLWQNWGFSSEMQSKWKSNRLAFETVFYKGINVATGATMAFRKGLKKKVLPFHLPRKVWHDAWLILHAAAYGGLRFYKDKLIFYRVHADQQVGITNNPQANKIPGEISYDKYKLFIYKKFPGLVFRKMGLRFFPSLLMLIKRSVLAE